MCLRCSEAGQAADVIAELLDGVVAVGEEVLLEEVTQVRVSAGASSTVHVKDTRVQGLLVVQGKGHCIQTTSPILPTWFSNSLKQNPASSHVLILQQLLSLFPLFHGALQEKTGEFWQGNIIPVKVHPQRKEGVGSIELEVDQFVDVSLRVRMEVLFHHRLHVFAF